LGSKDQKVKVTGNKYMKIAVQRSIAAWS